MYDRNDSAPSLLSFLIGGIVGASLTCLLAPQSGIGLRRRVRAGVAGGTRKGRAAARRLAEAGLAVAGKAAGVLIQEGPARVPEPGLPTDMGGSGRG